MEEDRLQAHKSLMHELIKGKELANDLKNQLSETSSSDNSDSERLVQKILASYSEALSILSGRDTQGISSSSDPPSSLCNITQSKDSISGLFERKFGEDIQTLKTIEGGPVEDKSLISASFDPPGSSISLYEAIQSKYSSSGMLKRKSRQDTHTVKINSETLDDGYCWRKYGQKHMLNSKYPRSYYRCTHRHTQGCLAVKQVQRSDEDPTVFDAIYRGLHTCEARVASKRAL